LPNYQSENEIIALNRVLHNAMSQVPVGVVVTQTGERRVVVANSEFHRIMGISQGSLINSTLKDAFFDAGGKCFYPDSGVFNEELFVHHLLSRNHYIARGYEVRIHQPGGSQLNVLMHSSPVLDDKKQTIAMVTIVQDITRIKKKEEAQLRKEAHLEYALSATVDGLWDWDIPGDKDFLSSRALVTEKDENGVPVKMVGTHQDITREMDLKQAQKRINQKLAIEVKRQTKNLETTNQ